MFKSNVKKIMKNKGVTIRDIVAASGISSATLTKARQDDGISECRLSTLGRIGEALGVKTKRLYDETDGPAPEEAAEEEGAN